MILLKWKIIALKTNYLGLGITIALKNIVGLEKDIPWNIYTFYCIISPPKKLVPIEKSNHLRPQHLKVTWNETSQLIIMTHTSSILDKKIILLKKIQSTKCR